MNKVSINQTSLIAGVTRAEVESHNPSELITLLTGLENKEEVKILRGKISLIVQGYDSDPEELFEINDFSIWANKLCMGYSSFAYFLNDESINLVMISALKGKKIENGLVQVDPEQQQGFLQLFLTMAIKLGVEKGYTEEEMTEYFSRYRQL
jgi:hypothetical protein